MGSPNLRAKQKKQTRQEIIDSAMMLFAESGFDNVPVESICERAGISRATFFNYFPQKENILAAALLSRVEARRDLLKELFSKHSKMTLQNLISILVAFCKENADLGESGKILLIQILTLPASRASLVDLKKQVIATLAQILAEMHGDGLLCGDPKLTAETMFSLYLATNLEWLIDPDLTRGWLTKTLRERMQLALEGFGPKTPVGKRR